jgi:hypothetical protein
MQQTASCASHERRGRATIHSPPNILSARHTSRQTQRNGTGRNLGGVEANNTSHQIDHHRPRWTGLAPRSESRSKHLFRLYAAKALFIWNSYAAPFILTPNCIMGADMDMKHYPRENTENPYSPLTCIVLLLAVVAAIQLAT